MILVIVGVCQYITFQYSLLPPLAVVDALLLLLQLSCPRINVFILPLVLLLPAMKVRKEFLLSLLFVYLSIIYFSIRRYTVVVTGHCSQINGPDLESLAGQRVGFCFFSCCNLCSSQKYKLASSSSSAIRFKKPFCNFAHLKAYY